jgi:hypothetical protein
MRKLRWPALVGVLALIGTGAAVASMGGSPRTDPVSAEINAVRTALIAQAFCPGEDGFYRQAVEEFRGTITSSDARLSGNVVVVARTLLNLATGFGTDRGSAVITDPATGRVKGKVKLTAVLSPFFVGNGVLVGTARGAGDLPSGVVVANYTSQVNPMTGALHAELGSGNTGATNGANTAVIQRGSCGLELPDASAEEGD